MSRVRDGVWDITRKTDGGTEGTASLCVVSGREGVWCCVALCLI